MGSAQPLARIYLWIPDGALGPEMMLTGFAVLAVTSLFTRMPYAIVSFVKHGDEAIHSGCSPGKITHSLCALRLLASVRIPGTTVLCGAFPLQRRLGDWSKPSKPPSGLSLPCAPAARSRHTALAQIHFVDRCVHVEVKLSLTALPD
jgi:hypothetical protein